MGKLRSNEPIDTRVQFAELIPNLGELLVTVAENAPAVRGFQPIRQNPATAKAPNSNCRFELASRIAPAVMLPHVTRRLAHWTVTPSQHGQRAPRTIVPASRNSLTQWGTTMRVDSSLASSQSKHVRRRYSAPPRFTSFASLRSAGGNEVKDLAFEPADAASPRYDLERFRQVSVSHSLIDRAASKTINRLDLGQAKNAFAHLEPHRHAVQFRLTMVAMLGNSKRTARFVGVRQRTGASANSVSSRPGPAGQVLPRR